MALPLQVGNSPVNQSIALKGHSSRIYSVAFSPSANQLLASGSYDHTIQLWNTESGGRAAILEGHSRTVTSVAFSPDGSMLASGSWDKTIKLWNVESGAQIASLEGHSFSVSSIALSADGEHLISGSEDKTIRLWSIKSNSIIHILMGHSATVASVGFSPDGKTIASGSSDSTVRLWDVATGYNTAILNGHSYLVTSVTFSPSGEYLASGSHDRTIRLWDARTGTHIATVEGHLEEVRSVTFSPDSKYLASGSFDQTIRLWDVASRAQISIMNGHSDWVRSVAFSPNGRRLASGGDDRMVRIWSIFSEEAGDSTSPSNTSELIGLQQNTGDSQQDTASNGLVPLPTSGDITGSVSLKSSTPIGYGGFADLFLGVHKDHGKVALKKPRRLLDEALVRRFLREVELWCSVSHRYVLPCLGMCNIGSEVYIVTPFIENGDLLSCMARGMDLNRSKLLYEVAEALCHLHHRGIVHGDVKAQNILLGDDGSALLCDFGMAKAFDTMVTSTESKGAGSVRWMAPELFMGESRSMASDVYSLGITIAEVLSGHAPYDSMSENLAVLHHVVYNDGRPLKESLMGSEGKSYETLWETAEKCWVKDAKARPYMAEVLAMLFPLTREIA